MYQSMWMDQKKVDHKIIAHAIMNSSWRLHTPGREPDKEQELQDLCQQCRQCLEREDEQVSPERINRYYLDAMLDHGYRDLKSFCEAYHLNISDAHFPSSYRYNEEYYWAFCTALDFRQGKSGGLEYEGCNEAFQQGWQDAMKYCDLVGI